MGVKSVQATVYQGARRRYFTKAAAERSWAIDAIRRRCECDPGDFMSGGNTPPEVCEYHRMGAERFARMVHLLIVMFVRTANPATQEE